MHQSFSNPKLEACIKEFQTLKRGFGGVFFYFYSVLLLSVFLCLKEYLPTFQINTSQKNPQTVYPPKNLLNSFLKQSSGVTHLCLVFCFFILFSYFD